MDAIERAWQILDQIPGRATGAYSHSQVLIRLFTQGNLKRSWLYIHCPCWDVIWLVCCSFAPSGCQGIAWYNCCWYTSSWRFSCIPKWHFIDWWCKPSSNFWAHYLLFLSISVFSSWYIIPDHVFLLIGSYDDAIANKIRKGWNFLSHSSVPFILCFNCSPWWYTGKLLTLGASIRSSIYLAN